MDIVVYSVWPHNVCPPQSTTQHGYGTDSGYQLIWVLWWCTVAGLLLQILAARLGVVTGLNLAQMSRKEYPRCSSMALWIMTEIAIIGSDIQEVRQPIFARTQ